jgi:hypothetical protein
VISPVTRRFESEILCPQIISIKGFAISFQDVFVIHNFLIMNYLRHVVQGEEACPMYVGPAGTNVCMNACSFIYFQPIYNTDYSKQ